MPKFKINEFLALELKSGRTFLIINDEEFEFYLEKKNNIIPYEIDLGEINSIDYDE